MRDNIKRFILHKLDRYGYWGGRHTSFDNLTKSLPSHLRGDAKKVAKQLIKEGLLLRKPTGDGMEVSLNPKKLMEIKNIIKSAEKHLGY